MAANFPDPDEKKNAAQMLIFLLHTVAGYPGISQNAPLCDKARVLKCVLETLLVTVPQPDLHSAFECMCAQAKERIFRVLGGTSAGMELKKAAGAVYEATRTDRALVQSLTDAMAVVEKLVGSADGLSVERMADVIGDIALHQPCVSQLLQVFAVLLTCRYMQASCPPATLRARHMPGLTSTRRQFGLSAATSCERARRWIALSARRGSASSTSTGSVSATTSGRCMSTCRNVFFATAKQLLSKFSSIVKAIGTATLKDVLDALDGSAGAILTCSQMLRHLTSPPCLALRKAALTLRGVDALRMPETDFLAVAEWFSWWMQERICICMHDT